MLTLFCDDASNPGSQGAELVFSVEVTELNTKKQHTLSGSRVSAELGFAPLRPVGHARPKTAVCSPQLVERMQL